MRPLKSLIGKPVFDGERWIGEVEDIAVDPASNRVAALIVSENGLWYKRRSVPWKNVVSASAESVEVRPDSDPEPPGEQGSSEQWLLSDAEGVYGRDVYDASGQLIGIVGDLLADPGDGRIVGCKLSNGMLQDLLGGRRTIMGEMRLTEDGEGLSVAWDSDEDLDST